MDGTQQHAFGKPELMIPVRCNNHPMDGGIYQCAANPFFAVSDADGHFEINGLPPGTYTLGGAGEAGNADVYADDRTLPSRTAQANFTFSQ